MQDVDLLWSSFFFSSSSSSSFQQNELGHRDQATNQSAVNESDTHYWLLLRTIAHITEVIEMSGEQQGMNCDCLFSFFPFFLLFPRCALFTVRPTELDVIFRRLPSE